MKNMKDFWRKNDKKKMTFSIRELSKVCAKRKIVNRKK